MSESKRIAEIEASAHWAQKELSAMASIAIEKRNRSFGQLTRYTLARIEMAKRQYGVRHD